MEYRVSFINQIVFMFLNDIFQLFLWWVLFDRLGDIRGWRRDDIYLLYGFHAASYGFGATLFGNAGRLAQLVVAGQLDAYLTLPKDPLLHLLMSRSTISAIGDYLFGLAVCLTVRPGLSTLLFFLVVTALGGVTYTAFAVLAHSLSFFVGQSEGISDNLVQLLHNLSLYPESIFSPLVRLVTYTLVPAAFMSYIPVHLLHSPSPALIVGMLAVPVIFTWLAYWVFQIGLKRYESGNLFGTRS